MAPVCTTTHDSSSTTISNNMSLQYKVATVDILQTQNTTMSSLTIGKEVHNIPIMKFRDTSDTHHLKACGFKQIATALKGKIGYHLISDLVYTLSYQISMETIIDF